MDVEAGREVHLIEVVPESRNLLPVELDVVEVLAGANLLLVPASISEDQSVQRAEPVTLPLTGRKRSRRRNVLPRFERARSLAIRQQPRVGRCREHRAAEARSVSRRETHS